MTVIPEDSEMEKSSFAPLSSTLVTAHWCQVVMKSCFSRRWNEQIHVDRVSGRRVMVGVNSNVKGLV